MTSRFEEGTTMKKILALLSTLLFTCCAADAQNVKQSGRGSGTPRTIAAHGNDHGVNIVDFGADPTGTNDSTAAIQAAIDYALTNSPNMSVFCPDGNYKTTLPLYLDLPQNFRNAPAWNRGTTYSQG